MEIAGRSGNFSFLSPFFVFLVCAVVFFRLFFAIFNDLLDFEKLAIHEHSVKQDLICNAKQAMKRRKWAQV